MGPTQLSMQWARVVKRTEREVHAHLNRVPRLRTHGATQQCSPYVFMARCSVKHSSTWEPLSLGNIPGSIIVVLGKPMKFTVDEVSSGTSWTHTAGLSEHSLGNHWSTARQVATPPPPPKYAKVPACYEGVPSQGTVLWGSVSCNGPWAVTDMWLHFVLFLLQMNWNNATTYVSLFCCNCWSFCAVQICTEHEAEYETSLRTMKRFSTLFNAPSLPEFDARSSYRFSWCRYCACVYVCNSYRVQ